MRLSLPLLCALALLTGGCASSAEDKILPHQSHPSVVLRWGLVGLADVPTLDPALASDPTSLSVASLIFGGLVRLDSHLRVRPDGAERWSISHHGTVYTFFLRHNLRFADGRSVTAADFAAAIGRALGPEGSAGTASFYLGLIDQVRTRGAQPRPSVAVLDSTTLRITLSHPAAHFLAELAFPASFVPEPDLMQRYGPAWTDHARGFGPFYVSVWRHSRYLKLVRNPYYYAGKPALRQIILHFYQQAQSAIAAYQRGALDLLSGFPVGQTLRHPPRGTRRVPGLALDYLAFNTSRLPFYRLNARRAFAAVWSSKLAVQAMDGSAFASQTFVPSAFGLPSPRWRPTLSARTYLARARYPNARRFPPIALVMLHDPHVEALGQELQQAWQDALGISIALRPLNPSDYSAVLNAHAFDLAIVRWGGDYPDPQDYLGTQLGSSSNNVTGWSGRAYDRLMLLAETSSPSDARRAGLFERAARLAAAKVPLLPLDEPAQTAVISPALQGVELTPLGTIGGEWAQARFRA
jgi:ABC-type oligopeptide transport system substrate-binding subunit